MTKKELRKLYKQKRTNLASEEIKQLEENIYHQIQDLNLTGIQNIHLFLPIVRQKEINTYPIINFLQQKGKTVIISKSDFSNNTLTHYILDKKTQLKENEYGIPEPINATEIAVTNIDMVFVPLLISDKNNYRVGYGKGFYDRFLSECKKNVKTLGINFFKPIGKISDLNKYDIPLNHVIYPQ
ncbi:5-formyltetrahydrofolate cyclo-ligase [Tenacibaculum sp. 190524A02b]|uniref:5-formyltetrahydrofolate cyclo-ligase n=1 Tax=Tenacibaculum vairaonense TaxID=3137860 RepID=UPI0031FB2D9C